MVAVGLLLDVICVLYRSPLSDEVQKERRKRVLRRLLSRFSLLDFSIATSVAAFAQDGITNTSTASGTSPATFLQFD